MYRRRRNSERGKIGFGFDSFLDLIANVIGIIMRLILVAWVGARAYKSTMQWSEEEPPQDAKIVAMVKKADPEPDAPPHPLEGEIEKTKKDLGDARRQLLAYLDQLAKSRSRVEMVREDVEGLKKEQQSLLVQAKKEDEKLAKGRAKITLASLSLDRLQERSRDLLTRIQTLEKEPTQKKVLHYRTPVSKIVEGEELMFECKGGKVSYIDVPAFMHEIKSAVNDDKIREIAKAGSWNATTSAIGAFRLRFSFQAVRTLYGDAGSVRIQLASWVVEPTTPLRGEDQEQAMKAGSEFRRLVDRLDPNFTTVTFWVYPDSFALFRSLRDHLYDRGVEIAGRPIPDGNPIGASINGTKSRGQ